jgi:hypothetical protein
MIYPALLHGLAQVGIEDCLHIEFEYDKTRFHLTDIVTGNVHFLLVRIRIKLMELALLRKETTGAGAGSPTTSDTHTLTRFELMDGCPVRGERVPIRMFLAPLDLTPSCAGVANGMLTVRYFLNLVLVDGEWTIHRPAALFRASCWLAHFLALLSSLYRRRSEVFQAAGNHDLPERTWREDRRRMSQQ